LLVGSEGTLGLFTEATLRTIPLPGGRTVVLFGFARLDPALRAARYATNVTACELLDRRLLHLARDEAAAVELGREGIEAVLLVEYEGDSPAEARERGRELVDRLVRVERLALFARQADDETGCQRFWQLCQAPQPGWRGWAQPLALVEDLG